MAAIKKYHAEKNGKFVIGAHMTHDSKEANTVINRWFSQGYEVYCDGERIKPPAHAYEMLPPTGLDGGELYIGIRNRNLFVCEVRDYDLAQVKRRAEHLIKKLRIADAAIEQCIEKCTPDKHLPGCPVGLAAIDS